MNSRDNRMTVLLLCVALGGGLLYMGYNLFLLPLQQYDTEITKLDTDNQAKRLQILQIIRDRKRLQQWRLLSLPGVENLPRVKGSTPPDRDSALVDAQIRYTNYLRDLLARHNLKSDQTPSLRSVTVKNIPTVGMNVPVYTPLQFSLEARGRYDNMIKMVDEFEKTPLLHRIRSITIKQAKSTTRKGPREPLVIAMLVEALMVNKAEQRGKHLFAIGPQVAALDLTLLAVRSRPTGASILPWHQIYAAAVSAPERSYADLARKNVFEGMPPVVIAKKEDGPKAPEMLRTAVLTDVTITATGARKANLFDRANERVIQLRRLPGWNVIPLVKAADGSTIIRGEVVRIDTRGVVFQVKLFTHSPDDEPERLRFKKTDVIYSLYRPEADALVKEGVIRAEEIERTYKVPVARWEALLDDGSMKTAFGGVVMFRHDLVRGRILRRDENFVLIKLDVRYCSFVDVDTDRIQPHSGFCLLAVGERLSSALQTPLPENEVRELQQTIAQAP